MLPTFKWDEDYNERGIYFPEPNIIVIHPKQKTSSLFASILHETGHWLLFRLGDNKVTRMLNAKWDWLDDLLTKD